MIDSSDAVVPEPDLTGELLFDGRIEHGWDNSRIRNPAGNVCAQSRVVPHLAMKSVEGAVDLLVQLRVPVRKIFDSGN